MSTSIGSIKRYLTGFFILGIWLSQAWAPTQATSPSPQATPNVPQAPGSTNYLPLVISSQIAQIQLTSASTHDAASLETSFLPGSPINFVAGGANLSTFPGYVNLRWTLSGPCGTSEIFNNLLTLQPGAWSHTYPSTTPGCPGIYLSTVELTNGLQTTSLSTLFIVFPPSSVVVDNHQGFDRCALPTIEQMQNWWNNSPYWVFNLYIGGISFACPSNPLNDFWVSAVSQQGWTFILTWVGPQAPCKGYRYPMSSNSTTAYQQGRSEADAAAAAAERLGFLANKIIYYDVESYSGASSACRTAVASFLRGWAQRLHELGYKAGAYGAPCTSYISDWAPNQPPPDDVWIAHWYRTNYDANASVWDAPCLSNSLWASHQRLKQYAGGHTETWGGLSFIVDSSKLDGHITSLHASAAAAAETSVADQVTSAAPGGVRSMDLLTPETGWVLNGDRLLWTNDGGAGWQEITPDSDTPQSILAVQFLDREEGWLVRKTDKDGGWGKLSILSTRNGGGAWQETSLDIATGFDTEPVSAAYLDFVDSQTGWLALKLQSGSSFSLGRLFFTQDGGSTWEERSLPLGEAVVFLDAEKGWVTGGPSGNQIYRTLDGGRSWQQETLPLPAGAAQVMLGEPVFTNPNEGYLPITLTDPGQPGFLVYATKDGGERWSLDSRLDFEAGFTPGSPLPFSLDAGGQWHLGASSATRLPSTQSAIPIYPQGTISLDFTTAQIGWLITQEGFCQGDKLEYNTAPFLCSTIASLLATSDGGRTWSDITPP